MKRALVIRNVNSHDVPLDSLDNACVQAFTNNGFLTEIAITHESDIRHQLMQTHLRDTTSPFEVVLFRAAGLSTQYIFTLVKMIRTISKQLFLCIYSSHLVDHPFGRYQAFQSGASMVTNELKDIHQVITFISSCHTDHGLYTCPFCERSGFTEDQLWRHCPMYHINEKNRNDLICPICHKNTNGPFQVHVHNAHGPPGRGEMMSEFRMASSLIYSFALVICHNRKYNTFLLVQEFANSGFWLPGGRIDSGENPIQAAIRETKEEAGIDIMIKGLIKMEYHPKKDRTTGNYVRMRFIFYAEPIDCDQPPKSIPDYESAGATWCPVEIVSSLPLRGSEPTIYFSYVASGKPIYPLEMLHISSIH